MFRAQSTDYTCAISCILMVMDELNPNHSYEEMELAERCNTTPDKGTHPLDIINFFNENGYTAKYYENGNINQLEYHKSKGEYVIMIVSVDVPHCVVYKGNNNNHFFFDDPWYGENQSRVIRKFDKGGSKYPIMRWEVETGSLKKYYPQIDFSKIESYVGKGQYIVISTK